MKIVEGDDDNEYKLAISLAVRTRLYAARDEILPLNLSTVISLRAPIVNDDCVHVDAAPVAVPEDTPFI